MRPLPKSASQNQKPAPARKSERPSDALANVFAIPAAPLLPREATPDAIAPGPPLAQKDDGELTVGAESSEVINLDELDSAVTDDLKAAADSDKPPKIMDSRGQAYDQGLTGVQFGIFPPDDEAPPAQSSGSSANTPMEELEYKEFIQAFGRLGLTFRPGIKVSPNDLRGYHILLVERRWVWTDDLPRLRRKLILLFHAIFPDEIDRSLPTFERENAQRLAAELLKLLRGRELTALAKKLESTMPDLSPPKEPPPFPTTPDKEK